MLSGVTFTIVQAVTSRQHPVVARCRRLARGRSAEDRALLVEGARLLADALDAGLTLEALVVSERVLDEWSGTSAALVSRAVARAQSAFRVPEAVLASASPASTSMGIVAIASPPDYTWDDALREPCPFVALAVDVQDPGNVGSMIRALDAAGMSGLVAAGSTADPYGWKALRGAMGSAFRLPVVRDDNPRAAIARLCGRGLAVVATVPSSGMGLYDVDLRGPTALVVGSEGSGLAPDLVALATATLSIPMRPGVDSLNVAVATALVAYEARRQRHAG